MYIFAPYSSTYSCPLAMTDGAARLIELSNDEFLKKEVYPRLITRDPKLFWTSGQWMTERPGGSDISRTETAAVQQSDGSWSISGFKWFSSATDADMTLLLARPRAAKACPSSLRECARTTAPSMACASTASRTSLAPRPCRRPSSSSLACAPAWSAHTRAH